MATCIFCANELTEDTKPEHILLKPLEAEQRQGVSIDNDIDALAHAWDGELKRNPPGAEWSKLLLKKRDLLYPGVPLKRIEIVRVLGCEVSKDCLWEGLQKRRDRGRVVGLFHAALTNTDLGEEGSWLPRPNSTRLLYDPTISPDRPI
jgi:hypothetical protein